MAITTDLKKGRKPVKYVAEDKSRLFKSKAQVLEEKEIAAKKAQLLKEKEVEVDKQIKDEVKAAKVAKTDKKVETAEK